MDFSILNNSQLLMKGANMNKPLSWSEVIGRIDLVGGYIQLLNHGNQYFGPISAISDHEGKTEVSVLWLALRSKDVWRKCAESQRILFTKENEPRDVGNNRVYIMLSLDTQYTLYPKGSRMFGPTKVEGLTDEERKPFEGVALGRIQNSSF